MRIEAKPERRRAGLRARPLALAAAVLLGSGLLQAIQAPPAAALVPVTGFQSGGFTVPEGETWEIDGLVETDGSVVVLGTLQMRTGSRLRFVNVDTSAYQGGGQFFQGVDADKVVTDVGLWVLGNGVLDLRGSTKTGWTRDPTSAVGWSGDDNIRVAPTARRAYFFKKYNGTNQGTFRGRRAEVFNLTRDVVIEGPGHILIRSSQPQTIRYVLIKNMGVGGVLGRYPLHFHHAGDGSRGTVVLGTAVWGGKSHAFVPHMSHGITLRDTVAFDTKGEAYWWNRGDDTDDVLIDHALSAKNFTALDSTSGGGTCKGGPKCQNGDFLLGSGDGMVIRDSVAVGSGLGNGFFWPSQARGPVNQWVFKRNVSHNNRFNGFGTWQNSTGKHQLRNSVGYNNGAFGISHGAYVNTYRYFNIRLVGRGTGVVVHANASGSGPRLSFRGMVIRGYKTAFEFARHVAPPGRRTLVVNSVLARGRVFVDDEGTVTKADFVNSGLKPRKVQFAADACGCSVIRIQNGKRAWKVTKSGVTRIKPFRK